MKFVAQNIREFIKRLLRAAQTALGSCKQLYVRTVVENHWSTQYMEVPQLRMPKDVVKLQLQTSNLKFFRH